MVLIFQVSSQLFEAIRKLFVLVALLLQLAHQQLYQLTIFIFFFHSWVLNLIAFGWKKRILFFNRKYLLEVFRRQRLLVLRRYFWRRWLSFRLYKRWSIGIKVLLIFVNRRSWSFGLYSPWSSWGHASKLFTLFIYLLKCFNSLYFKTIEISLLCITLRR